MAATTCRAGDAALSARMLQTVGPLTALVREVPNPIGTVVLLHGLGLGPWLWEPWFGVFAEQKLNVVALTMPGHGTDTRDVSLQDCVDAVAAALDTISGPVTLIGHSAMAVVAQLVAQGRPLHALVLMCPMPPRGARKVPERPVLKAALKLAVPVLAGRPVKVGWEAYHTLGLANLDEPVAREIYEKITAWPNRFVRDVVRPPEVDALAVTAPTLVALGKLDAVSPWQEARVLGDLYEAVVWRYDDLGHMPTYEATGLRMARDVARFCAKPVQPQVIESEGFMPTEGVGHDVRKARRGEMMKKRSAYGQKKSART